MMRMRSWGLFFHRNGWKKEGWSCVFEDRGRNKGLGRDDGSLGWEDENLGGKAMDLSFNELKNFEGMLG